MTFLWIWIVALIIEFLLLDAVGFMMVGVIFWTFTAMFIWCLIEGFAAARGAVYGCTIYTGVVGLLIFLSNPIENFIKVQIGREVAVKALIFGWSMGGIFLLLGVYMGIIKLIKCTMKVEATCIGHQAQPGGRGLTYYSPIFEYKIQSKCYRNTTGEIYTHRKIKKKFVIGQNYQIYTDPRNPMVMRAKRTVGGSNWLMLIIGVALIVVVTCKFIG